MEPGPHDRIALQRKSDRQSLKQEPRDINARASRPADDGGFESGYIPARIRKQARPISQGMKAVARIKMVSLSRLLVPRRRYDRTIAKITINAAMPAPNQ